MAYTANELFSSASGLGSGKNYTSLTSQAKTFAPVSGGATLAALTPVAYNTSTNKWVKAVTGGSNGTSAIRGFLINPITLDDSGVGNADVLGVVMLEGKIDYAAIPQGTYGTEAQLKAALQSGPRDLGLIIEGLDSVR